MNLHHGCNHKAGNLCRLVCPMQFSRVGRPKKGDLHKDQVLNLLSYLDFVLFVVEEAFASSLRHNQVVGPSNWIQK